MPIYMEVVATLHADGFANSGHLATGRILKVLPDGPFRLTVEEVVTGVSEPVGKFATEEDARSALFAFWNECQRALTKSGTPSWRPKIKLS